MLVERKKRTALKAAVAGAQDFRGIRRKEHDVASRLVAEQVCEAHIKAARHLPQERDGRSRLARLDLAEHGATHAREHSQALQTQAATLAQARKILADAPLEFLRLVLDRNRLFSFFQILLRCQDGLPVAAT